MIPEIIIYLLKVNLALILFFLGYCLLLKRYTFYKINRYYLLTGLTYSAFYPLLDFNRILAENSAIKQFGPLATDWEVSIQQIVDGSTVNPTQLWQFPLIVFWSGVVILSIRFISRLISLRNVHRNSEKVRVGEYTFRKVRKQVSPFSFWKSIYINPTCHSQTELIPILEHEQVHVDQLHTLDVLFTEICTVFYWFNPGVWMIKTAIKANLEYITDQEVLRRGVDKKDYQYALLRINSLTGNNMPVNNFKILSLKQRIMMINKKPSNKIGLGSYLLVVPAIIFFLSVVSVSQAALHPTAAKTVISVIPDLPVVSELFQQRDTIPQETVVIGKKLDKSTSSKSKTVKIEGTNGTFEMTADTIVVKGPEPLYILDGREVISIRDLDPTVIGSITVLKDANTHRIYGDKGKNGVIEIITKGSPGDTVRSASLQGRASNPGERTVIGRATNKRDDDAVTVVGYGRARSGTNSGSTTLSGSSTSSDASESVTVVGYPRQKAKVSLDGINNALIYLDGREIKREDLDAVPASHIGDIEVVKGKTAVDLYGRKGKNGVILITTKK